MPGCRNFPDRYSGIHVLRAPEGAQACSPGSKRRRRGDPGSGLIKICTPQRGDSKHHGIFCRPYRGSKRTQDFLYPGSPRLRRSDPGLHPGASLRLCWEASLISAVGLRLGLTEPADEAPHGRNVPDQYGGIATIQTTQKPR